MHHQGNTGEVEAVIKAATWAEGLGGSPSITLHYAYSGIANWVSGDWKANDKSSQGYVEFIKARKGWVSFSKVSTYLDKERNEQAKTLARRVLEKT